MRNSILPTFACLIFFPFLLAQDLPENIKETFSEKEIETFLSLPSEAQEKIISNFGNLNQVVNKNMAENVNSEQDTVLSVRKNDNDLYNSNTSEYKIFGFDYFLSIPTTFTPINDVPVPTDYELTFGDVIEINFKGEKTGSYDLTVLQNGTIYIPEIGEIMVINETFERVVEKINDAFTNFYISVQPSVSMKKLSSIQVMVLGSVQNPGAYLVNPFTSIYSILSYAGGIAEYASLRKIEHRRGEQVKKVDMYDFLINGNSKNISLRSGDIIFVPSTNKFVLVEGEVNRPGFYEILEGEDFLDVLNFSQGYTKFSNEKMFQIKIYGEQRIESKLITDLKMELDFNKIIEILIPKDVPTIADNIYIFGEVSDQGPFQYNPSLNLESLIKQLSITEKAYRFFGVLENKNMINNANQYIPFSLNDNETLKDISIYPGSKIYLFNYENIGDVNDDYIKSLPQPVQTLISNYSVSFKGQFLKNIDIPVYGKVYLKDLTEFVGGFAPSADKERIEIISPIDNATFTSPGEYYEFSSPIMVSIYAPKINSQIINVKIDGEVNNPGTYPVLSGTTLNDLYKKAGGLKDTASADSIIFLREKLKAQEQKALEIAQNSLVSSIVDTATNNAFLNNMNANLDVLNLLNDSYNVVPVGRISGDLHPSSEFSINLLLENNDEILVPLKPQTLTIFGEVNNQLTTSFEYGKSLKDYIKQAGGYKDSADKSKIFVIKSNGTAMEYQSRIFEVNEFKIEPGDTIIVPKDLDRVSGLPLVKVATDILSSLAFSAASLNAIQD